MLELNKIYQGDYLELMPLIDDKSIDAVVTDPPFGIGFKYEKEDVAKTVEKYEKFIVPLFKEIKRVLKNGGFFSIWQPALYFKKYWDWFGDDIHIYAGCKNFVQLRKTPINYAFDPIIIGYKGKPELRPVKPKRNVDFFVANTAKWVTQTKDIVRQHPCPRPIDQVFEIVLNFTIDNAIVLDPFIGSGTTAIACMQTNRNFIGIELEPKYVDIANKRLANTYFQGELIK